MKEQHLFKAKGVIMKIGILTYHYSLNYGAALQCYALKTYLSLNNEVHVLNYEDDNQFRNSSMYNHGTGIKRIIYNLMFLPFHKVRMRKKNRYEKFANTFFSLTERVKSIGELEKVIIKDKYDCIIVGSDQVWNPNIKDFTESYFLPISLPARKIAYAVSTGDATIESLMKFKNFIIGFDAISIRESGAYEGMTSLFGSKVSVVPDPVFLLKRREWDKVMDSVKSSPVVPKYLLCYFMNKKYANKYYNIAEHIAKQKNLRLIRLNPFFSSKSLLPNSNLDAGPMEFLRLVADAEYICTDSFHGTAFSMIFHKDFISFDYANGLDTRKKDLLKIAGLQDRLIENEYKLKNCNNVIDYNIVDQRIQELRKKGIDFLMKEMSVKSIT